MRDLLNDDQGQNRWRARLRRTLLDLDSRIDFGIYQARTWGRELYERYTVVMDRFHVSGWRRWLFIEPSFSQSVPRLLSLSWASPARWRW